MTLERQVREAIAKHLHQVNREQGKPTDPIYIGAASGITAAIRRANIGFRSIKK